MIIQIEGEEGIRNIDEILDVDGIDIVFIGPYDLSQSLDVPGQTTHEKVVRKMKEIAEHTSLKGMTPGTFTDSYDTMKMWKDAGVKYVSYSVDVGIFYEACRSLVDQFRAI